MTVGSLRMGWCDARGSYATVVNPATPPLPSGNLEIVAVTRFLTVLTVSYGKRKTLKRLRRNGFAPLLTFLTVKKVYMYERNPLTYATLLCSSLIGDMFPETVRSVRNVRTRTSTGLEGLTPSYGQALWSGILTARPLKPVPRK